MMRRLVDTFQLNAVPRTVKTSVVPHPKAVFVTNTKTTRQVHTCINLTKNGTSPSHS